MSEQTRSQDPARLWRDQPEEKHPVNLQQLVNRRTEELSSRSRSEILMSIGSAVLLFAVLGWRLAAAHEEQLEVGFAAVLVWVAVSLYGFRRRIWRRAAPRPDAVASSGLEYYRAELERRRDHLRNEWLWHGPLFLAAIILAALFTGKRHLAFQPLRNVLPLLVLLALWVGFGLWRRRLQARQLQREIDELTAAQ
jgi:hypothetical protein